MPDEDFQSLLHKAAARHGIGREFRAIQICRAFDSMLPEIFDQHSPEVLSAVKVKSYKNNIITVQVPSSAWANEILIKKHRIIDRFKLAFPKGLQKVKDIKTELI